MNKCTEEEREAHREEGIDPRVIALINRKPLPALIWSYTAPAPPGNCRHHSGQSSPLGTYMLHKVSPEHFSLKLDLRRQKV